MTRELPQNIEAEKATLGSMLLDRDMAIQVASIITADSFSTEKHRLIFEAITTIIDTQKPLELVSMQDELTRRGVLSEVGGISYLAKLTDSVATAANAEYYARQVQDKYLLRTLIKAGTLITQMGYEASDETGPILDKAEQLLFRVTQRRACRDFSTSEQVGMETYSMIESIYAKPGSLTGVPTGFKALDEVTAGWQPSAFYIIAARPSMGKTTFVLNLAENAAVKNKVGVGVFSLEMSRLQLGMKFMSSMSGVDSWNMQVGSLKDDDWPRLSYALGQFAGAPILIDDTPGISVQELRAKARRMVAQHHIGLIVIDYLQLMRSGSGRKENRQQEVSDISASLKALARELNIPVIACSQLSRGVEHRDSKIPGLADLRESGSLEQDADMVAFLYREDYYNHDTDRPGMTDIIIAKHRAGSIGTVELRFRKELSRFEDSN